MSPYQKLVELLEERSGLPRPRAEKVARKMRRLGFRAVRLAETACNRGLSAREEKEDEKTDKAFRALCAEIGVKPHISGDPRGYVYHIVFPGENAPHNTWGRTGWGVTGR